MLMFSSLFSFADVISSLEQIVLAICDQTINTLSTVIAIQKSHMRQVRNHLRHT